MVSDFNSKPLVVDGYDEEHQDLEDEDMDESDSEEEDEADRKACEVATNLNSIHALNDLIILCWLNSVARVLLSANLLSGLIDTLQCLCLSSCLVIQRELDFRKQYGLLLKMNKNQRSQE
jgi:hypothetical protein